MPLSMTDCDYRWPSSQAAVYPLFGRLSLECGFLQALRQELVPAIGTILPFYCTPTL